MRPLNRPMFRYGGPIKEGIMDGMKDNRQAINTVGSPLAPKDETGRGGYAFPLIPAAMAGLSTLGRLAIRPLGQFVAKRVGPGTFTRPKKYLGYSEYGMPVTQTAKTFQKAGPTGTVSQFVPNKFGSYLLKSPEGRFITGAGGKAGAVGKKVIGAGKSLASSPLTVGSGVIYGGKSIYDAMTGEKTPEIQQQIEQEGGPPGGGDPGMFARPKQETVDEDTLNKMNKDRIQQTRERYYKLMGLDKASKDTIANSLIKASQIVQEEGADLKGSLKSGTLQNRIIQAIAGEADKDKALKRQIDAAILKGEIEKDIKASDPNEKLAAEYRRKQIALADKSLSGDTLKDTINAAYSRTGVFPTGSSLAGLARVSGIDITSTADSVEVNKWLNDNKGKNEIDYLEEAVSKGTPDGNYVVNSRVLIVKDGKVIPYI